MNPDQLPPASDADAAPEVIITETGRSKDVALIHGMIAACYGLIGLSVGESFIQVCAMVHVVICVTLIARASSRKDRQASEMHARGVALVIFVSFFFFTAACSNSMDQYQADQLESGKRFEPAYRTR